MKSLSDQAKMVSGQEIKAQFLANVSHEIRTPLNAIVGCTEILIDPNISIDEKNRSVAIVRRNCDQLLKIVDEILDLSSVAAGGMDFKHAEFRVQDLLTDISELMAAQTKTHNGQGDIDFKFEVTSPLPSVVVSDEARLRQTLTHLIGNAVKFTQKGHVHVQASFCNQVDDGMYLCFRIEDTGIGIEPSVAARIFQPFSPADPSNTRAFGGTGLGLPLARRLAQALGGDVSLERSQPGVGSVFALRVKVMLPNSEIKWIASTTKEDDMSAVTQVQEAATNEPLRGKCILLVEDAEDNQFLITQFLSRTGATVDVAGDGEAGVRKALAGRYDLVLMDIQMPVMDGYEATQRLRQAGFDRPIIALTAHALREERERCLNNGCNGHLTKPISRRELIEGLIRFLEPACRFAQVCRQSVASSRSSR